MAENILPNSVTPAEDNNIIPYEGILSRRKVPSEPTRRHSTVIEMDDNGENQGTTEQQETGELLVKSYSEHAEEFCDSTTLHGIRYVATRRFHIIRRFMWLLLLLAMTVWLIYGMMDSIFKFFRYPMSSVVTMNYVTYLPFPVVTLCNYNQWRKSTIDPASVVLLQKLYNPTMQSTGNDESINWDAYEDAVGISRWNLTELAFNQSHQAEDMIQKCSWRTVESCGPENFTRVITDSGVCYSFNHHLSMRKTLEVRQPGSQNGLYLRLNVEQNEYTSSENAGAGLKILMHPQGQPALVKSLGFSVAPGFAFSVSSRYTKVENLPWPFQSNCTNADLQYSTVYTVPLCQHECKINYVLRKCGCRDYRYPGEVRVCSPRESYECITPAEANFTANNIHCDCPVPCNSSYYDGLVSMAYWPNTHITQVLIEEYGNLSETTLRYD
ncbi:acid-sensing ion channel 1C-like [Amphiura filiformis]|uniref:acid-sensing ion channel 1C-like n=1 Tax=Amphiura filiformis TaxID=82378 RepID=UPI003B20C233